MYMQERIEALRRDIDKHGKVKAKKGQQAPPAAKVCTLLVLCLLILPMFPLLLHHNCCS